MSLVYFRLMMMGNLFKLLSISSIVVAMLVYIARSSSRVVCKECKNDIQYKDKYCPDCGIEINSGGRETIMRNDKRKVAIMGLSIAIVFLIVLGGMIIYAKEEGYLNNLATGVYSEKRELFIENNNIWAMKFKSALSEGTLKHEIKVANKKPNKLKIKTSSESGTAILKIEQGDLVETVDISNTNGEIDYDLMNFVDEDIQLRIEHSKLKEYSFYIEWE